MNRVVTTGEATAAGSASGVDFAAGIPDDVLGEAICACIVPIEGAIVTGPEGEEIHTDEYGRVKVAFHWDREDEDREQKGRKKVDNGEKFFCWVRVGQTIAGNKWGFMAIPRIGQEVVVDFIEGDPDRPLVVGSVYNAEQMPHYQLPAEKTKSYVKTNSSLGGDGSVSRVTVVFGRPIRCAP